VNVLAGNHPAGVFPYVDYHGPEHPCFFCGESLGEGMVVHWSGTGFKGPGTIFIHPKCVPTFCRRLLMDWERAVGFLPLENKRREG
jgi:hypothetical protein